MNVEINFEEYGQGETVVVLHGLFGSARNWRGIAKQLAEQYHVFTLDLRNHGESGHNPNMRYADMATDVAEFLHQQKLERASVIGHSMGGKTAMTFALNYPSMLDKLIILDIAPVKYQNEFSHLIESMLSLDLENITSRQEANTVLGQAIGDNMLSLFLLQNLVRNDEGFRWRINLQGIHSSLPDISNFADFSAEQVHIGPTLFLAGEQSDYIQECHHDSIQSFFPNSVMQSISNAAHWLHADQPERVFEEISAFLAK